MKVLLVIEQNHHFFIWGIYLDVVLLLFVSVEKTVACDQTLGFVGFYFGEQPVIPLNFVLMKHLVYNMYVG